MDGYGDGWMDGGMGDGWMDGWVVLCVIAPGQQQVYPKDNDELT